MIARWSSVASGLTCTIISTPPSQRATVLSNPFCTYSVSPKISRATADVMIAATVSVTLRRKLAHVSRST